MSVHLGPTDHLESGWMHAPAERANVRLVRSLPGVPLTAKALALAALRLVHGSLDIVLPNGRTLRFGAVKPGPHALIFVRDWRFAQRALSGGDVGLAESYMAEEWDTPDLSAVLEMFAMNFDALGEVARGNPIVKAVNGMRHAFNANTKTGSKRNILAHYDLGNRFYARWLDASMTYSSARFTGPGQSLEEGQIAKYAGIADQLRLQPDQHLLEIGSGWGGFAEYAAKERGAKVTGLTISNAQYEFARKRIFDAGLAERVDFKLMDYRDVEGSFDGVASIEMFEAVGERYWPVYFGKVHDVLKPGGRAALQIITIDDHMFERYRTRADFIQRYVFPGGMLPSIARLRRETEAAGLAWDQSVTFGQAYARTLSEWADRFRAAWREIKNEGFDERFKRLWTFYLSYCEAGFRTGRIDVGQFALVKPRG
jgi:cyclopropane-fatty-acyl-phospholipid synthase